MAQLQSTSITGSLTIGKNPDTSSAGNLWYNSTTSKLNLSYTYVGCVWSTGGPLISATNTTTGAGDITSAISVAYFGNAVEKYNGSSWSAASPRNNSQANDGVALNCSAGAGTSNTAALFFGGFDENAFSTVSCTEAFNGTSWSSGGAMITARACLGGAGTPTAALGFGGTNDPSPGTYTATEAYNGTSWSTGGNLNSPRSGMGGHGASNTAALSAGGSGAYTGYTNTCTETYNGTSWSTISSLITAIANPGAAGTPTSALIFGGGVPQASNCVQSYNGTSWSTAFPMSKARYELGSAGTSNSSAIGFGGTGTACTEVYSAGTFIFVCEI